MWLLLLLGCSGQTSATDGLWTFNADRKTGVMQVEHGIYGPVLQDMKIEIGEGQDLVQFSFGSFKFEDDQRQMRRAASTGRFHGSNAPFLLELNQPDGRTLGFASVVPLDDNTLVVTVTTQSFEDNRITLSAACDDDDHFLGLGGHAMDVDHVGEAFPLWVSEPGIGKTDTDEPPADWFSTGTKHASSTPIPFLLRAHRGQGLLVDTRSRVEVDLCASDPGRFSTTAWEAGTSFVVFAESDAGASVEALMRHTGRPELPQPWVFAPWNDAIRGSDRVREVATALRTAGAPSSVIWTEDWKGADASFVGYHLGGEWTVDETLYPQVETLAQDLEDDGFKFFAYFSPFVREGYDAYDSALAADALIRTPDGEPYLFPGAVLGHDDSLVDLSSSAGREWAQGNMQTAIDLGFDGWMADFAEWLPTDAVLASGESGWTAHNDYPLQWQRTNQELIGDQDVSYFVRSAWTRTGGTVPVVWGGDQRTSFDTDDGMPTVVAMGAGLGASGVPVFTHDVAGYNSVGNDPSDQELWFRWAWLGAFSPVLRTHHGAFDTDNHQFDTNADTLAHWAVVATEHTRLWPYRYGLAAKASARGTPMLMPVAFRYGEDWDRIDSWLLGDALLVAPILERGATSRHVDLPADVVWYDWFTHEVVTSGEFGADVDEISVFAAAGTTVPVFAEIPDTLFEASNPDLVTLSDVDGARVVYLFAGGGEFHEGDGTSYLPTGAPSGAGEVTQTLTRGTIEVAGVTLDVDGPVERAYTVVVIP